MNHIIVWGMAFQEQQYWEGGRGVYHNRIDTGRVEFANMPYAITDTSFTARIDGPDALLYITHYSQGASYIPFVSPPGFFESNVRFENSGFFSLQLKY